MTNPRPVEMPTTFSPGYDLGPHLWENPEMRTKAINTRLVELAAERESAMNYVAKGIYMTWTHGEMLSAWKSLNDIQDKIDQVKRFEEIF